jgi:hypothetical protein
MSERETVVELPWAAGSLLGVVRVAVNKLRYRFYGGAFKLLTAAMRAPEAVAIVSAAPLELGLQQSLAAHVAGLGAAWGWVKVGLALLSPPLTADSQCSHRSLSLLSPPLTADSHCSHRALALLSPPRTADSQCSHRSLSQTALTSSHC